MPRTGFPFPLRVRVENHGPARDVECVVESSEGGGENGFSVHRRFRLGEREKTQFSLLVPGADGYATFRVFVDGSPDRDLARAFGGNQDQPGHLVVDSRTSIAQGDLDASFAGTAPYSRGTACCVLPPDRLSDQWQSYAGVAGLWVRAADWKSMPAPCRQAILRAVTAGARLFLYETGPLHGADLQRLLQASAAPGGAGSSGAGWLRPWPQNAEHVTAGFGDVSAFAINPIGREKLGEYRPEPAAYRPDWNQAPLGIEGVGQVPFATFFWVILFFAILIGPVNFIVVLRLRQRMLFLLTTPLLALLAVGTLFGYSVVHEGFTIRAAVRSVTLLNADEKEAVVLSKSAVYSPLSSGVWAYRPDTLCVRQIGQGETDPEERYYGRRYYYRHRNPGTSVGAVEVDWTQGQALSKGWVPARRLAFVATAQVVPDRARLSVERTADGSLRAQNGLGRDIKAGQIRWHGKPYVLPALRDGAAAVLQPGTIPNAAVTADLGWFLPADFYRLEDGEFVAVTQQNPDLDAGGKNLRVEDGKHLIKGGLTE